MKWRRRNSLLQSAARVAGAMDLDALAARASALVDGAEHWVRTAGQTVGFNENDTRRPGFGILRVVFKSRGRGGVKSTTRSNANVLTALGQCAYDGGVSGVFETRGHAMGEATRFRLWVELAFPPMADVVPLMSAEAQRVLRREADRERVAETRAQNQTGAARVEERRHARRAMARALALDDRAATYKELELEYTEAEFKYMDVKAMEKCMAAGPYDCITLSPFSYQLH